MKRLITFAIFIIIAVNIFSQAPFIYTPDGKKIQFKTNKEMVLIKTKPTLKANKLSQQTKFKTVRNINEYSLIATIDTMKTKLDDLKQDPNISDVTYMLEYSDGTLQAPSSDIFVKCKKNTTIEQVIKKVKLNDKVKSLKLINTIDQIYSVSFDDKEENSMLTAARLYETGLCEFAEPSFIRFIKPCNTFYSSQWGLNNVGTKNLDISAPKAWEITRGNSSIRIAVIDEGVDLSHPDLSTNLLPGFDATGGNSNGGPSGDDAHGTACAGIIGAINNTIGIVGVAPSCRIIPIRIAYSNQWEWVTNDTWIVNGIHRAWATDRADILSNSWSGGSSSATITTEIRNAVTYGRNGLGCSVIFASGNEDNNYLPYPSSLEEVIAVGAISQCGLRKSKLSCEGENWGSNYGTGLDVVAPGVKIYTTDIQGSAGYNKTSGEVGNYDSNFGGTSAACPHVAGIAALILSVRPNLTQAQVRQTIESSCKKLFGYSFSSIAAQPNGTWNNQVGHGLVDAYSAVYSAINPATIVGLETLWASYQTQYRISGINNATWSCSGLSEVSIDKNTGIVTVGNNNALKGEVTITASYPGGVISKKVKIIPKELYVSLYMSPSNGYSSGRYLLPATIRQSSPGVIPTIYFQLDFPSTINGVTTTYQWQKSMNVTVSHPSDLQYSQLRFTPTSLNSQMNFEILVQSALGTIRSTISLSLGQGSYYNYVVKLANNDMINISKEASINENNEDNSLTVLKSSKQSIPANNNIKYEIWSIYGFGGNMIKGELPVNTNSDQQVDISSLPTGFYVLNLYQDGKVVHSEKFKVNR